jgi:hypothetical protein
MAFPPGWAKNAGLRTQTGDNLAEFAEFATKALMPKL